ncbi:hypothetical protein ACFO0N_16190 [Halobium salinum]|uniref:KaiC-like domain-containing protein n=1 Tax=Halobium salinum TaxID=1364940 RepID=A0ABD5PF60_9EURY|nr:hypothetical protein [Halobium salinum]
MSDVHDLPLSENIPADAASVLLLAPSFLDAEESTCCGLLGLGTGSAENVLWVSYTNSPDTQFRRWREAGGRDGEVGVISVGESSRSAGTAAGVGGGRGADAGTGSIPNGGGASTTGHASPVRAVSTPTDLTGLGIAINEYLHRWRSTEGRTVVCFDSVTALVQYVDLETTFEFLHVVTGRVYAAGGLAHFHMNPLAHDERTVESVASLVDAVVELDEDGVVSVRSR